MASAETNGKGMVNEATWAIVAVVCLGFLCACGCGYAARVSERGGSGGIGYVGGRGGGGDGGGGGGDGGGGGGGGDGGGGGGG